MATPARTTSARYTGRWHGEPVELSAAIRLPDGRVYVGPTHIHALWAAAADLGVPEDEAIYISHVSGYVGRTARFEQWR